MRAWLRHLGSRNIYRTICIIFLVIAALYFNQLLVIVFFFLALYVADNLFLNDKYESDWLYRNRKLDKNKLADRAFKDLCYSGLLYMASREEKASNFIIRKITSLMNSRVGEAAYPVMVTVNINEHRVAQNFYGKTMADMKEMIEHLPHSKKETLLEIYRDFAADNAVSSHATRKGLSELRGLFPDKTGA